MPQVRNSGTAWERRLDDYTYTKGLDGPGWAWEFLRRNAAYAQDYRTNRAGHPVIEKHASGTLVLRLRRRVLDAENWGLYLFADPQKSLPYTQVFWLTERVKNAVSCRLHAANDNDTDALSLAAFVGHRWVLVTPSDEIVVISDRQHSACMVVRNSTFLIGLSTMTFEIPSLNEVTQPIETLKTLRRLLSNRLVVETSQTDHHSKYLDYLVALDGRLASRSYRDIAEVLYGTERIGPYWTDDSRGYKSKVRRAVENGLALMNGGYRTLL